MLAGGDTTDILTMKNVTDYARYATRGQLKPLTEAAGTLDKASYSGGLDDYNLKDQYYALPYRSDFWVLFYNKDMVGRNDLSKLTWDDYAKLAKKLTRGSGSDKVYGTYLHTWRSVVQAIASAQTGGDQLGGDYGFFKKQYDMVLDLQKSKATLPFSTASTQQITYDSQLTTGKAAMVPMALGGRPPARREGPGQERHRLGGHGPDAADHRGGESVTFGSRPRSPSTRRPATRRRPRSS